MIIAIETSTDVCSVAVQATGRTVWEKRIEGRGVHSERLFTFLDELLERAGITIAEADAVLFSRGPGSYTGLRIGASAVKGLLFRQNVPLYTFPTLFAFAAGVETDIQPKEIWGMIDARRSHLYCQKFYWDGTKLRAETSPDIQEIAEVEGSIGNRAILVGTGLSRLTLDDQLSVTRIGTEGISAKNLILAFNNEHLRTEFSEVFPKTFDPEYLEIGQINNSKIRH